MNTSDFDSTLLPDVEALARLANEFFPALPGTASTGATPAIPSKRWDNLSGVADISRPQSSLPDSRKLSADEQVPRVAEHLPGSQAGVGISHPAARSTALPNHDRPGSHRLSADSFELPFPAELNELLSLPRQPGQVPAPTMSSVHPQYYFQEYARGLPAGLQVPGASDHLLHLQRVAGHAAAPLDVEAIRRDFPILREQVNGRPLVWLDNAATTQKPSAVIERLKYFYEHENSNIHRAAHELAARATDAYESARYKVRCFLNAASVNEIVFVRGTTEAINLVAQSWGKAHIGAGDEIVISWLEHHANIVPWHRLCAEKGAQLRVIPVDDDGQILIDEYAKLLNPRTRLVAFTQVSNALGTITPAKRMIEMAHGAGAKVLLDGAQSVSHMQVDMQDLHPDFFVFSGHKIFGPTGIGVLYGKEELLNSMQPWQGGGNMIKDVTFENIQYHPAPHRFEAGTGNIADAVGLGAALDYVGKIGMDAIQQYEHQLLQYATRLLKNIPGLRLIGTAHDKASVISLVLDGFSTEQVGAALNKEGIAVRSGHHCAQPILRRFGLEASVRPSLAFYNNCADVDRLAAAIERISSSRRLEK